jgi:hypothetical protein
MNMKCGVMIGLLLLVVMTASSCDTEPTETPTNLPSKPTLTATSIPIPLPIPTKKPTLSPEPVGIEGIDFPVISRGVDFLFYEAQVLETFRWETNQIQATLPFDLLLYVKAESKHFTSKFPCEQMDNVAIWVQYSMPGTSAGGGRWEVCLTDAEGWVIFVFPIFSESTEFSILLPGEPPFVLSVPLDSLLDMGG